MNKSTKEINKKNTGELACILLYFVLFKLLSVFVFPTTYLTDIPHVYFSVPRYTIRHVISIAQTDELNISPVLDRS